MLKPRKKLTAKTRYKLAKLTKNSLGIVTKCNGDNWVRANEATTRFIALSNEGVCLKWNTKMDIPMSQFYTEARRYITDHLDGGLFWRVLVLFHFSPLYKEREKNYFSVNFTYEDYLVAIKVIQDRKVLYGMLRALRLRLSKASSIQDAIEVTREFYYNHNSAITKWLKTKNKQHRTFLEKKLCTTVQVLLQSMKQMLQNT